LGKIKNRIVGSGEEQLDQIMFNPRNWRIHPLSQQDALKGVLEEVGWVQQVIVNKRTGNLIDGHLRCQLAAREGAKTIPVVYVDVSEDEEALVLATLDPIGAMAATDKQKLEDLTKNIQSDNEKVNQLINDLVDLEGLNEIPTDEQKEAVKNGRGKGHHIDIIWTQGYLSEGGSTQGCCIATRSGWLYGIQSTNACYPCPMSEFTKTHKVEFVDNDYFHYDHQAHLEVVKKLRPKYCTVRDIMNQSQCEEAGIEFFELSQILEWAEDLRQYAENVIVIPKYDCLSEIPDHFVLGYSVPTSHGGTPLPIEMFKGRRVHLLGGSPNKQIAYWQQIPEDVVSLDNNYILLMAKYGQVWLPTGETTTLSELGVKDTSNPHLTAIALSVGYFTGVLSNPLYAGLAVTQGNFAAYFGKQGDEANQETLARINDKEIRQATKDDIDRIKDVAKSYSKEIGFILRPALEEAVNRAELLYHEETGSFCHYHTRRDGVSVIYEICTPIQARGKGIAKKMISKIPLPVQLKCPVDNASNKFYEHTGFELIGTEDGKKRRLNVWKLNNPLSGGNGKPAEEE
jgi:hypothetical protein